MARGTKPMDVDSDKKRTYAERHKGKLRTYKIVKNDFVIYREERAENGARVKVKYCSLVRDPNPTKDPRISNTIQLTKEAAASFGNAVEALIVDVK